jgi:hypothetical protein
MRYVMLLLIVALATSCGPKCNKMADGTGEGRGESAKQDDMRACDASLGLASDTKHNQIKQESEEGGTELAWERCMGWRGWTKEETPCSSS